MANSVNTFGVLSTLRRIEFGDFDKKLISLDYLLSLGHIEDLLSVVKPVNSVFKTFNQVNLEENEVNNIMNGKPVKIDTVLKMDDNILDRSFTFAKFKDEIIAVGYIKDKAFTQKIYSTVFYLKGIRMVVKKENEKNKENVGSSESQITIFTNRINRLTEHLKNNKKDENTRRGLMKLVGKRKKLLNYLKEKVTINTNQSLNLLACVDKQYQEVFYV